MISKVIDFINSDSTYLNMVLDIRDFCIYSCYVDNEEHVLPVRPNNNTRYRKSIESLGVNIIDKNTVDTIDSDFKTPIQYSMLYTEETLCNSSLDFITSLIYKGLFGCYNKTFYHIYDLVSSESMKSMDIDKLTSFMKDMKKLGVDDRYKAMLSRANYFKMRIDYGGINDDWFYNNFFMTPIYLQSIKSHDGGFIFGRLDTIDFTDYNTAILELTKTTEYVKMDIRHVFNINMNNTTFTRFI